MQEWTDPFNSFNSMKGLLYRRWMEAIIKGDFLPPVEASVDPVFDCNLDCIWCNSRGILKNPLKKGLRMTTEHLFNLCRFLGIWGVKGVCFAGGGEPFLHRDLYGAVEILSSMNVDTAFLTNGTLIEDEDLDCMVKHSRFVGCSVDAATPEKYQLLKRTSAEMFHKAVDFLKEIAERRNRAGTNLEITYKFLIHPENIDEIYPAAVLARKIGVDSIHFRPAASQNVLGGIDCTYDFPLELMGRELQKAQELETEKFKVYSIRHKFSRNLTICHCFSRCLAAPLLINLGADGRVYNCVDHRGKDSFSLGSHFPHPEEILSFWSSEGHRKFLGDIDISQCPRCTFGIYNRIIEEALIKDKMCMNFP